MSDPSFYLTMASAALAGLAMLIAAGLSGWRGWLQLKQQQLAADHDMRAPRTPGATPRIEIPDLQERRRSRPAVAATPRRFYAGRRWPTAPTLPSFTPNMSSSTPTTAIAC